MNLIDILKMRGFDITAKTKIMRHQDKRFDLEMLFRKNRIDAYQSIQSQDVLNCEYAIAFIGRDGTKGCFAGIWKVVKRLDAPAPQYTKDFPYPHIFDEHGDIHYLFERVPGFDDLIGRLVIEWGAATRAWHQWLSGKEVIEILPEGQGRPFAGFLDFVLSFDELDQIICYPEANRVWHQMLSSVAGVYLITDNMTGQLYVGSAYGKDGVLGRWKSYVATGHGGNKALKAVLAENVDRKEAFSFTILRTLPRTLTQKEVIAKEQLYKQKLGSRAHGLNLN